MATGEDAPLKPMTVALADAAADHFQMWREAHGREKVEGLAKDAWAKMPGQVLRLALVLEYLWWSATEPQPAETAAISLIALEGAIRLIDTFFKPMARRVFGDAGQPDDRRGATALARYIVEHRIDQFNASKARREAPTAPKFLDNEPIMARACVDLVEAGWLKNVGQREGETKGRPSKDFQVNPTLWAALDSATAMNG